MACHIQATASGIEARHQVMQYLSRAVPRNLTRGIGLLKSAANDGSSFAQWKLGLCCKSGNGTLRDPKEADKWFAKSAEGCFNQCPPWKSPTPALQFSEAVQTFVTLSNLEHRQAMFWLGICYEHGLGVPRDLARGLDYYMRAGNKGYSIATEAASRLKQRSRPSARCRPNRAYSQQINAQAQVNHGNPLGE